MTGTGVDSSRDISAMSGFAVARAAIGLGKRGKTHPPEVMAFPVAVLWDQSCGVVHLTQLEKYLK